MKRITVCPKCKSELLKDGNMLKCCNNHSYDIAKQGYVNLSLGNSYGGGDDKEMCRSRHEFHSFDYYNCLSEKIANICSENRFKTIIDAGCGEGYYIRKIRDCYVDLGLEFESVCGIDLAKEAVLLGARMERSFQEEKRIEYVVAGIFDMPLADKSAECILSVFAPVPDAEASRVLKDGGIMIVVSPGPKHLDGLKKTIYDNTYDNEINDKKFPGFELLKKEFVCDTITVDKDNVLNLFHMTPYYWKTSEKDAQKISFLDSLTTKIEFIVSVYKKI